MFSFSEKTQVLQDGSHYPCELANGCTRYEVGELHKKISFLEVFATYIFLTAENTLSSPPFYIFYFCLSFFPASSLYTQ